MIRKLIRQMLTAQIFSALTVSLCLLIDSVMIGRFLGEKAIAAYGLANPLLLAIGALGSLLAAGIQVACGKSLGKGLKEETDRGYSSALAVAAVVSLVFTAGVLAFRSPLAAALGAGRTGRLFEETRDYLAGFSIGAPGSMGALVLVPFLQMAGRSGLLIAAVLTMTVTDVALDLLNVLVFHGGMFGMGLASSVSYYAAMLVAAFYFLSRKCVFRFSLGLVSRKKIAELFRGGIPAGFGMASSVILVYVLNQILNTHRGSMAVAAYTVINTIGNSACCISTGVGGVSLTLSGIFYNEEDRNGLRETLQRLFRASIFLGLGMGLVLLVFAPYLVSLFIPAHGPARSMAILGTRIYAAGLIPCCLNYTLKNAWQATGRPLYTEIASLLDGAVFPALGALILSRLFGTTGVWLFFFVGHMGLLLLAGLVTRRRTGRLPWQGDAMLLLKKDFGSSPDELLEIDLHTMEDVTEAARKAERFCREHGQSPKVSNHIALCIEEMASNTILHGFTLDRKTHHLLVRVLKKPDHWVLRFRDDCGAFDPIHYIPQGGDDLGIRLVTAMAEEANYTYSLNLNNLALKLRAD
ncbi:MAG: ATP-binding protein [Clostridia bacterium]|nr:ATP-binding protein [Clostridia bacterium]